MDVQITEVRVAQRVAAFARKRGVGADASGDGVGLHQIRVMDRGGLLAAAERDQGSHRERELDGETTRQRSEKGHCVWSPTVSRVGWSWGRSPLHAPPLERQA
jgi:hypothetical protein